MPFDAGNEATHPTKRELLFLELAYNRFYDLFEEIMADGFYRMADEIRYSKLVNVFSIFTELTKYKAIGWAIDQLRRYRPPGEAQIASDLIRFIRHVVVHYPLFERWKDVWISGKLASWDDHPAFIQKFLQDYSGHTRYKFRFW